MKIKAGITGAAGYTGGELLRLLFHHPDVQISFAHSKSHAGHFLHEVHHDLLGDTDLKFAQELSDNMDVLFLCVGHGESEKFLAENPISSDTKIIDLSQDFRSQHKAQTGTRKFVYGLPELNKQFIREAGNIANPGCFATAIQLALLPLAANGVLEEVYTTGITGSTGAGQGLSSTSHFSWRANNIQAYKSLQHQHIAEIEQSLRQLFAKDHSVHFVPWRGDFTRGIYTSSITSCALKIEEVKSMYRDFYSAAPFTHVSDAMIDLKQVVNTNKCLLHIEKQEDKIVIHSAIDNLLKGASGQAVQNMNLLFGLKEETGLHLKATAF